MTIPPDTAPLRARVAAILVLLYAQPLSRIVRFTISDILPADGATLLHLGDPLSPVPEPFAALLHELQANRVQHWCV